MFEQLLELVIVKVGIVGIPLSLVVWIGWNATKNANKQNEFVMDLWKKQFSDMHIEIIDGKERVEEYQTSNLLLQSSINDRLGNLELRSIRVRENTLNIIPNKSEELVVEMQESREVLQRHNVNTSRLIELIAKIGEERRNELKRRRQILGDSHIGIATG